MKGGADSVGNSFNNQKERMLEVVRTFNEADDAAQRFYEKVLISGKNFSSSQAEQLGGLKDLAGMMKAFPKVENKATSAVQSLSFDGADSGPKRVAEAVKAVNDYETALRSIREQLDATTLSDKDRADTLKTLTSK
jgi:hypothetical protein